VPRTRRRCTDGSKYCRSGSIDRDDSKTNLDDLYSIFFTTQNAARAVHTHASCAERVCGLLWWVDAKEDCAVCSS
jgi:hypothetical protein